MPPTNGQDWRKGFELSLSTDFYIPQSKKAGIGGLFRKATIFMRRFTN